MNGTNGNEPGYRNMPLFLILSLWQRQLLANVKKPPNNAGHPPFSVLTRSLTGGFKFGNGIPRRQSIPRPFPIWR